MDIRAIRAIARICYSLIIVLTTPIQIVMAMVQNAVQAASTATVRNPIMHVCLPLISPTAAFVPNIVAETLTAADIVPIHLPDLMEVHV